jgi:hypothetical protein
MALAPASIDFVYPAVDAKILRESNTGASISATIDAIKNNIRTSEQNNLIQNFNAADGQSNNALTYTMMLSRNKSISDISKDMIINNNLIKNGPKDTYARQAEINEWQAQDKLDTLFFLQLTFIFFALMVFLLFLRQSGAMPHSTFMTIGIVFSVILVGVLISRSTYTKFSRDNRYWNRRFIGIGDGGLNVDPNKCPTPATTASTAPSTTASTPAATT